MTNKYLDKIAQEIEALEKEAGITDVLGKAKSIATNLGRGTMNAGRRLGGDIKSMATDPKKSKAWLAKSIGRNPITIGAGAALGTAGVASALRGNNDK